MRRTAEETIRNLEMRIARLEKQSMFGLFRRNENTTPRYSVETEEKAFLRALKSVSGVSKVSDIDLSNPKKLRMTFTYKGFEMELGGWCGADNLGIYGGKVKGNKNSHNSYILYSPLAEKYLGGTFLDYAGLRRHRVNLSDRIMFEIQVEELHKTHKYYVKVEEEERLKAERHRESLRRQEIYRKKKEEESGKSRQITRDRLERKRKKREEHEERRRRNEERRRNR
jgi:hypothetical protein